MRVALVIAVLAVGGSAGAQPAAPPAEGQMLFVKGDSLFRGDVIGKTKPAAIAKLGPLARSLTRIESNSAGTRVLLVAGDKSFHWLDLAAATPAPIAVDCTGWADLSPDGYCVLCPDASGALRVHWFKPKRGSRPVGDVAAISFFGPRASKVLARTGDVFEAVVIGKPTKRTKLASAADVGTMVIASDHKTAAAVIKDKAGSRVETFLLDGVGTRRRLMSGAVPLFFSHDAAWLAVQVGARTCITRTLGGQYRCYDGFEAVGLSRDGLTALMRKGAGLYRVKLTGARGGVPKLIVNGVRPAVLWLPPP